MTDKAISPLRRRLIEDMAIRRLSPKTHYQYIRHVKKFADFLGRSADKATYRGCPSLSVVAGVDRDDGTDCQCQCHGPAVLLQGHAEALRSCRGRRLDPARQPHHLVIDATLPAGDQASKGLPPEPPGAASFSVNRSVWSTACSWSGAVCTNSPASRHCVAHSLYARARDPGSRV